MTDTELLYSAALITGVWLVTVLSPGPNFLAASHAALTQSRRQGVMVSLGIGAGTMVWAVSSLVGLGVVFQNAAWLYGLLKLAGGVYLIYLGLKTLVSPVGGGGSVGASRHATPWQAFRRGLVVDLSNPKAAVFFVSLFAVAVPPQAPLWFQAVVVTLVVLMAVSWYSLVAWLVNMAPVAARLRAAERMVNRITGTLFVFLGARLVVDHRS